jgi:hypothetical protein
MGQCVSPYRDAGRSIGFDALQRGHKGELKKIEGSSVLALPERPDTIETAVRRWATVPPRERRCLSVVPSAYDVH